MLRITIDDDPGSLTLRLEGRLEGPWVEVLAQCHSGVREKLYSRALRVSLNGLTFIDARGKAKLAEMHAEGAQLLGDNLEAQAIVAEIQSGKADHRPSPLSQRCDMKSVGEKLAALQRLTGELHTINQTFAEAAKPLRHLDELNEEQRQRVAADLRARFARWQSVTQEIHQVMEADGLPVQSTSTDSESESR